MMNKNLREKQDKVVPQILDRYEPLEQCFSARVPLLLSRSSGISKLEQRTNIQ